ncbi:MAG: pyridoxamine 5'-phosphate oxidase family protein, partial [Candidatus Dormibacteraeota bacterium]|nr:pyridoxamine 5'-phosphate oxidase family protein [Candidatus Dormibacteraeota bacterium]
VRPDGIPIPSPVWFHWDGHSFLIYSQPDTPKLRDISSNPQAAGCYALQVDGPSCEEVITLTAA